MSYYQPPYGIPSPYGIQFPGMSSGYPGGYPYPYPYAQRLPMPFPTAPQPFAQPQYPSAYAPQSPYMAQQPQLYQPQPYAQQSPYGAAPQPYPAQTPYAPAPMHQQQQYQPTQYAQPMQQQTIGNVTVDAVGLPVVPGDVSLQFPQTFTVEEKILSASRDSFYVRDQQGAMRYKVDGTITIHEHKTMKDMHGQVLLRLRESRLKMREKITIFDASNQPLMTLQKASAIQIGSKRVHGYIGVRMVGNPAIIITGNYNNTHFRITNAQGTEIAIIRRRKFSIKNMTTGQDTYEVVVNHGSPAFVCFLTVALDEIYED